MSSWEQTIIQLTGAVAITRTEPVQTLWSGYGEIKRYGLKGGKYPSVIVKHIHWPDERNHPRGWNTEVAHQRKLRSYQVEQYWYRHFSSRTDSHCKVPQILDFMEREAELLLIMEDLDANGYDLRLTPGSVALNDVKACLTWLAHFHAKFMGTEPSGLWPIGTYWHLDTRPEEWEKMKNEDLKQAAKAMDQHLNQAQFQTLVHGDAKLANFCFSESERVAAVDFQYVGKGCGMKDVAYFIGSCLEEAACEKHEKELLHHYFEQLKVALAETVDFPSLLAEWKAMYKYAWADFYRFLDGWSPGHWKMHAYSERLTRQVLKELKRI